MRSDKRMNSHEQRTGENGGGLVHDLTTNISVRIIDILAKDSNRVLADY
jgi:hypothetical protein